MGHQKMGCCEYREIVLSLKFFQNQCRLYVVRFIHVNISFHIQMDLTYKLNQQEIALNFTSLAEERKRYFRT